MKLIQLAVLISLFPSLTVAEQSMIWRCNAIDGSGKVWTSQSHYVKTARNRAHGLCKKESTNPWQCFSSREICEVFTWGTNRTVFWRCTAHNNQSEGKWLSGPYTDRLEAAAGALRFCEQTSKSPDGCYINTITCQEIN